MFNYIMACHDKHKGAVLYPMLHTHMFLMEVSYPFVRNYTMYFLLHIVKC